MIRERFLCWDLCPGPISDGLERCITPDPPHRTSSYLRVILMWIIVIALDLALDFRLEFLWPCWMFLKRIFESFKYKSCVSFSI